MLHLLRAALEACDLAVAGPAAAAAAVPVAETVAATAGVPIAATATEPGLDRGPLPKRARRYASRDTAGSPGRPKGRANGRADGRANGTPAGRDAPLAPVGRRYVETPTITPRIDALVDGHIGASVGGQGDVLRCYSS